VERSVSQTKRDNRLGKWPNVGAIALLVIVFILLYSRTLADPDLWGHLRFGRDIWESGQIGYQDPYSYLTGGQTWINHEWLAEVVFWGIFAIAGARGLVLLKLFVGFLTFVLLYAHLRRSQVRALKVAILLLAAAAIPLWRFLITVRPQLFTLLFFTLTILVIHHAERGRARSLWLLAPLFVVWANCHGGFLSGVGVLVIWGCAHIIQGFIQRAQNPIRLRTLLTLLGPIVLAVAGTLFNPYGLRLWAFLLRTATVPRPEIREWQPLELISVAGISYLVPLGLSIAGLLYSRLERQPSLMVVYACTAFLPFVAIRHLPLFAVSATILGGEHVNDVWTRRFPRERFSLKGRPPWVLVPWLFLLSVFVMAVLVPLARYQFAGWRGAFSCIQFPEAYYPVRAVALLKTAVPEGNLAIDFDWGEYAIWHLGPDIKVSIDGRRETIYSEEVYKQNLHFMRGERDWSTLLEAYPTDLALVRAGSPTHNLLRLQPGWIVVYEDPVSALFVREDSPLRERLEAADPPDIPYDGRGLCFPQVL
jgi:hypothetical protein